MKSQELEKRISALDFLMEQISDFKFCTRLSVNYHDQKDSDAIEQATAKNC